MRKVVKIVYSAMYQKTGRVSYQEKVIVTILTFSILLLVILMTVAKSV